MKKHPLIWSTVLLGVALLAYFLGKPKEEAPLEKFVEPTPEQPHTPAEPAPSRISLAPPDPKNLAAIPYHPEAVSFGNDPAMAEREPAQLLALFDHYRETFGSFPSAEGNAQFMNALRGANPKKHSIFPSDNPRLNPDGEILDFWGSPFFFHQISANHIEIRSPGPDREIYTEDDITAPDR